MDGQKTSFQVSLRPDPLSGIAQSDGQPRFFRAVSVAKDNTETNHPLSFQDRNLAGNIRKAVNSGALKDATFELEGKFVVTRYSVKINGVAVGTSSQEVPLEEAKGK